MAEFSAAQLAQLAIFQPIQASLTALTDTVTQMNTVLSTELSAVNDKVDTLKNDFERRLAALEASRADADGDGRGGAWARTCKGKAKGARSASAGADDDIVMGEAAPRRSGSAHVGGRSVPAAGRRGTDESEWEQTQRTVVVSGFPQGTTASEVKSLLCGALSPESPGYARSYMRGWRVSSAFLEYATADAARDFLRRMRDAQEGDRPVFKDAEDDSTHRFYFRLKLTRAEGHRQAVQRRIKRVLTSLLDGAVPADSIGIEKGRGEVWVRKTLVARVGSDGGSWRILPEVAKYAKEEDVRREVERELATL